MLMKTHRAAVHQCGSLHVRSSRRRAGCCSSQLQATVAPPFHLCSCRPTACTPAHKHSFLWVLPDRKQKVPSSNSLNWRQSIERVNAKIAAQMQLWVNRCCQKSYLNPRYNLCTHFIASHCIIGHICDQKYIYPKSLSYSSIVCNVFC